MQKFGEFRGDLGAGTGPAADQADGMGPSRHGPMLQIMSGEMMERMMV